MPRPQRQLRKRLIPSHLDFSRLEDRQLLAANLSSGLQVPNDLPAETNLVTNGDFETFDQGSAPSVTNGFATGRFLPGGQVTGWGVTDGDNDGNSRINLVSFANDRATVLDLDSIPDQDDRVFQDITTQAGQQYLLAFDFRNSPLLNGSTDNSTNDFEVYWNGNLVASMTGGNLWQTASFTVIGSSDDPDNDVAGEEVTSRLEFRDMRDGNRGGDGRGALIDCVRLTAVSAVSIVNGGFEDVGAEPGPDFSPDDVEGWSVFNFSDDAQPRVIRVNAFQSGETAIEGDNYLALNSDSSLTDQVFQDIATTPDRTYFVTFDYRTDPASSADPDQLRVRWNNAWAATFVGSSDWQSVGILLDADSDTTRLNFREAGGDTGDGAGVHIDNVQIFLIDQVVNDLAIDLNGTADGTAISQNFIEGSDPLPVAPSLLISHDSGTQLSSALISLQGEPAESTESLALDSAAVQAAGLTAQYNVSSGVLTLEGDATVAQYQTVLRTLTYQNTSEAFGLSSREIGFQATDDAIQIGGTTSGQAVAVVTLTSENDAPQLTAIEDQTVGFGRTLQLQTDASDVDGESLTYSVSVAGLAATEVQPTISSDGEFSWIPSEAGTFEVTVTTFDAANAQASQTFDVTVGAFVPFEGTGALSNIPGLQKQAIYTAAPPQNINTANRYDAVFDTDVGEIRIRLLDDESPTFVNNFVNLARDGFYDGLVFHRVIDGFVAQGGDPQGTSTSTVPGEGAGQGGPGYQIPDEDNSVEFDSRGQLSYANSGVNTTGSQFFITFSATNLPNSPTPQGQNFTVFGNVTSGDAVLDQIERTFTSSGFGDTPIPDAVPTVINSVTIIETPGNGDS